MGFIAAEFLELALVITNFGCQFRHYGPLYKVRTVCTGSAELLRRRGGSQNILPIHSLQLVRL